MRTTIRFNEKEEQELEDLKRTFHISDNSKALKLAVEWVNHYIKNVTQTFFPPSFDIVLIRKLKTQKQERKVYDVPNR